MSCAIALSWSTSYGAFMFAPLCFADSTPEGYPTAEGNRYRCSQYAPRPIKQNPHAPSHLTILSLSMLEPDDLNHTTIPRPKSLQTGCGSGAEDQGVPKGVTPVWSSRRANVDNEGRIVAFQTRWIRIKRARDPEQRRQIWRSGCPGCRGAQSVAPAPLRSEDVARIHREDFPQYRSIGESSPDEQEGHASCFGADKVRFAIHSVSRVPRLCLLIFSRVDMNSSMFCVSSYTDVFFGIPGCGFP
jgi:hypothetical protein